MGVGKGGQKRHCTREGRPVPRLGMTGLLIGASGTSAGIEATTIAFYRNSSVFSPPRFLPCDGEFQTAVQIYCCFALFLLLCSAG